MIYVYWFEYEINNNNNYGKLLYSDSCNKNNWKNLWSCDIIYKNNISQQFVNNEKIIISWYKDFIDKKNLIYDFCNVSCYDKNKNNSNISKCNNKLKYKKSFLNELSCD